MPSFAKYLNPGSIAIVGASRSPEKVGHQILKNLIDGGYKGRLYPINPNAKTIMGLKCFPTIHKLPKPADLVIIATPAPLVHVILEECIQNKIENVIVITAGFAENGARGKAIQQELSALIQGRNLSVLGPNCLGVLSPAYHLNAAFGPTLPAKGHIGLISQSGALVTGIVDWANKYDIGLSHAVTFGNRINAGEIEALEYFATDPHTHTILVYIESFQDAARFFSACSKVTPSKPVILLKGGQSALGQHASASHTAALASDYTLVKAFAKQAGVIIVDTLEEWLNVAAAFTMTPPPKGSNLTILTNAGGPGVLSTDEATELGLDLPEPADKTKNSIRKAFPHLNPHNPLDILGDASPEMMAQTLEILKKEPNLHNLVIIMTPQTTTHPQRMAKAIVTSGINKMFPTYAVCIGGEKMEEAKNVFEKNRIMHFEFPSQALKIIAHKSHYQAVRKNQLQFPAKKLSLITPGQQHKIAEKIRENLSLPHAFDLLAIYGFKLPKSAVITHRSEVPDAIAYVDRPAVAKTAGLHIAHKAQVGGVMLNLMTASQARVAFDKLHSFHPEVLFQQTIHGDLELILGAKRDPQLGPFVTIGWGGTYTNAYADRAYAFVPASKTYLNHIFSQTKAAQLLHSKNLSLPPVIDALEKLATLITDLDIIDEIEINPAIVTKKHLYAADIKITLR